MSDLVERLRARGSYQCALPGPFSRQEQQGDPLCAEAAAEIQRLRIELSAAQTFAIDRDDQVQECVRLHLEIGHLQSDLATARDQLQQSADAFNGKVLECERMRTQAADTRKALAALVDEFGCTLDQYHRNGPDFTHKDGTEVFVVSVIVDRAELIEAGKAALSQPDGAGGEKRG